MKINNISIFIKGEGIRRFTRKEFIDFIDGEAMEGQELTILKLDY